jgi:hypothetical protein
MMERKQILMEKKQQIELNDFDKLKESLEHQICLLPDIFKAIKSLAETTFANSERMNMTFIDKIHSNRRSKNDLTLIFTISESNSN